MSYILDPKKITDEEWLLKKCKERSLYIIENSSKTEKQLRDKLKNSKKYDEKTIDLTIDFLKQHNFLNDKEYTKRYIELNINSKSKKQIKFKLYEKGVNRNIIDEVFLECEDVFDDKKVAKRFLLKKYPNYYENIDDISNEEKTKIYSFLARKGISYETISSVMKV